MPVREQRDRANVAGFSCVGVKEFVQRFIGRQRQHQRNDGDEQNGENRFDA